jgi:hypothetical protein
MIYDRLGDPVTARGYFHRALGVNSHFHVVYSEVAKDTLARLDAETPETGENEMRLSEK